MSSTPSESLPGPAPRARRTRWVEGLAFSSGIPAVVAATLSLATSRALGAPEPARWAGIAALGSAVVYGLDRLRDRERDRATSPRRTDFVERHADRFRIAVGAAALGLAAVLASAPALALALTLAIGALGLFHRRLKGSAPAKSLYVSAAWTAIIVGLPALAVRLPATSCLALVGVFFPTFFANLVASNVRDGEARLEAGRALRIARACIALAIAVTLFAPAPLTPLVWIPVAQGAALLFFRPTELYGHLAVDGALAAGALLTLTHQTWL